MTRIRRTRRLTNSNTPPILFWMVLLLIGATLLSQSVVRGPLSDLKQESIAILPAKSTPRDEGRHLQSDSASSVGYQLAYDQSFGFFDDISDENWRRAQRIHARLFPNHFRADLKKYSSSIHDKGNIQALNPSKNWNAENFQEEFHCALAQRIPTDSNGDGPKWVCDPHRISKQKDCLVYSVGSNGNVMFERGVKEEIGEHCEIHTFDMATYNKRNGHFSDALRGYATFHDWGLGTKEQADKYARTGQGPALKTLEQTMRELGHAGRMVDIFKIDCEWCEWFTFRDWIQARNLRQILVETHNAPMPNARDFFYELHDAGYVIFSKEANFQNGGGGVEFAFLKLHTDFFLNGTTYKELGTRMNSKPVKRVA